ncbi:MAG: hypothetical protein J3K34DRAFT_392560 [Monoraphidium minutum]|nr:MAG: hypothetical protein J3K34DRAFT_392560 [Monoraphidium minutum]
MVKKPLADTIPQRGPPPPQPNELVRTPLGLSGTVLGVRYEDPSQKDTGRVWVRYESGAEAPLEPKQAAGSLTALGYRHCAEADAIRAAVAAQEADAARQEEARQVIEEDTARDSPSQPYVRAAADRPARARGSSPRAPAASMQSHPPNMMPYNPYMQPPAIQPGPHSHLTCGGCNTLLMYPQQGASNVRCSRCGHITAAPPAPPPDPNQAQTVCNGCRVLLAFPRGAQSVQCSLCHTVTQVPVYGHVHCGGCSIMLMYPLGAQSVKCSVCHHVTGVSQHAPWQGLGGGGAGGGGNGGGGAPQRQQQPPKPPTQTVVVEQPPSVDEAGNEVPNIAVGVQEDIRK